MTLCPICMGLKEPKNNPIFIQYMFGLIVWLLYKPYQNHHLKSIRHLQFDSIDDEHLEYVDSYLQQGKLMIEERLKK